MPISDLRHRLCKVVEAIYDRAALVDETSALPIADVEHLHAQGLIHCVIDDAGGECPLVDDNRALGVLLEEIGAASLTVGRLYEGHVNAAKLIRTYGGAGPRAILNSEATSGFLLGVWNAEKDGGVRAEPDRGGWLLDGRKVHCSGAGYIRRPVVTARDANGQLIMLLPDMNGSRVSIDTSIWRASGMRGTTTGTVIFDKVPVEAEAVIGSAGDYYRSPLFSGGAWRVLAVQLGGLRRILELHAERLRAGVRHQDPVYRARFANAAAGFECARLLVAEAGRRAETPGGDAAAIDAYVDQARGLFETIAMDGIAAARCNVGLQSFIAPDPLDRCIRDLETYLRQPFVDASRDRAARWLLDRNGRFEP